MRLDPKKTYRLHPHAEKRQRSDRPIPTDWIEETLYNPQKGEDDPKFPDRRRHYCQYPQAGMKVLRVVYTETSTHYEVITYYWDRGTRDT